MSDSTCPKCGTECHRDEADVGVGVIYGPWGCPGCGWSENPEYDHSEGKPPAAADHPGRYVDQFGNAHSLERMKEDVSRFGLDPAVIDDAFKDVTEPKQEGAP